jgi:hypothetical protein
MSNAIIGVAFNYSYEQIAPFLNSLNQTGFTGDLVLYINNKSTIEQKASYKYKFILINFEKENKQLILKHKILKWILLPFSKFIRKSKLIVAKKVIEQSNSFSQDMLSWFYVNYYLATMRFVLYYHFLVTNKYANVFFSDVSDVIFQDDIFKAVVPSKIIASEEKKDVKLGQDEYNSHWVIETTGQEAFKKISSENIYCSGTILADYSTAITFLKDYIGLILSRDFNRTIAGLDQGFYNYMVSFEQKKYFKKSENGEVIFTVALNTPEDFVIEHDKIFYSEKREKAPLIVHQYTRHPKIAAYVKQLYSS